VLVVSNGRHHFQSYADGLHFKHAGSGGSDREAGYLGLDLIAQQTVQSVTVVPITVTIAIAAAYGVGEFR
ncbi:hypothetical protein LJB63_28485, partial [[Eubacterium] rectale]|nr:hypothetical protein [Agathobacter rectalis]